ncbi:hypothetical protein INR76_12805 [Marixanthomonas sp. SCSIO 43207]|uniref:hypothetical protein n=1 Tax=Marixanthomonas sp. SCSIO 43207 TaxID=2779360 RepID=UPI001CA85738|nr:hypothetical protein [Marixanthomonas sp. SCSIO 43207]UAB80970.1 hypothetical protein INR76_12805 [Marixanthomonas sp. SCSIO 43207]
MDFYKIAQTEFSCKNLKDKFFEKYSKAKKLAEIQKTNNIKDRLDPYFELNYSVSTTIEDYNLATLDFYINSKNELLKLSRHPIFWFALEPFDDEYIQNLSCYLIRNIDNSSLDDLLNEIENILFKIFYYNEVIHYPDYNKKALPKGMPSNEIIEHPFFEQTFIRLLRERIVKLENQNVDIDNTFHPNDFDLNIISIMYLYHFLNSHKLLKPSDDLNFFLNFLGSSEVIIFDLKNTEFTKPDLDLFLGLLQKFYQGFRDEYIEWVKHKIRYISKQGKTRYGDSIEIKKLNTIKQALDKHNKIHNDIKNTIELLNNTQIITSYLNKT